MVELRKYKNGIRLLHQYMPNNNIFTIRICAMVGSNDEKIDEWGIAHLLEHMTFKSTKNQTTKQISITLDKLGGSYNAFTSNEMTVYYITTTVFNAKEAVNCLSDVILNTDYDKGELENEKSVVCNEIRMYEDDYTFVCQNNLINNFFANTPFEHPLPGNVESVSSIDKEKLKSFKQRTYKPGRIIISTAGGIETDNIYQLLDDALCSKIQKEGQELSYCLEQKYTKPKSKQVFVKKETEQVYCNIAMPGYNASNKNNAIESVINILVGGCMSSRLFVGVREEKGLVYHISCSPEKYSEYGMNTIYFISNKEQAIQALKAIRSSLDNLKKEGFTQDELEKAKSIFINATILGRESISGIAGQNLKQYLYKEELLNIDDIIAKVKDITLGDINTRMKEILNYNEFVYSIVAKEDNIEAKKYFE